jgi:predicted GNAT family acetyltransferase
MALDPRSVGEDTADVVVELEEDEMLALMRSWVAEEHHETPEGTLQQIDEANRREGELWNERALGVRDDDGKPVAVTKLRSLGQTAWVEDVYTAPQARRRGYARRLVTRAVAIASEEGHDFAFILADDECWPKVLYSAVGFRPTGKLWSYRSENVGFYP